MYVSSCSRLKNKHKVGTYVTTREQEVEATRGPFFSLVGYKNEAPGTRWMVNAFMQVGTILKKLYFEKPYVHMQLYKYIVKLQGTYV